MDPFTIVINYRIIYLVWWIWGFLSLSPLHTANNANNFEGLLFLHTVGYCIPFHSSPGMPHGTAMALSAKKSMTFQHRVITSLAKAIQSIFCQTVDFDSYFPLFLNEPNFVFAYVTFLQTHCFHVPKITLDMAKEKSDSLICTTVNDL